MKKQILMATLIGTVIAIIALGVGMRFLMPAPANVANQTAARGQGNGGRWQTDAAQPRGGGQGAAAQGVQWTTVQGTVMSVDSVAMTVQTAKGEQIVLQNRPWTFALEQKFAAKVGDTVSMSGFYQNGQFEVGQLQNVTTGATAQVRDQSGRPNWAGRGNGYNASVN